MEQMSPTAQILSMVASIIVALGGIELVKFLFNLRYHRRASSAQADQEETTAEQKAADLRRHELETANQMLAQVKEQNAYLGEQIKEYNRDKEEDRRLKSEMRYEIAELKRKTAGLQDEFTKSETRRKQAERYYCAVESCKRRRPPLGTYSSDAQVSSDLVIEVRGRDASGRFVKKNTPTEK
jgi:hypothetical protein